MTGSGLGEEADGGDIAQTALRDLFGPPRLLEQEAQAWTLEGWLVDRRIVVARTVGSASVAASHRLIEFVNEVAETAGRVHLFVDWSRLRMYEHDARSELTRWGVSTARISRAHILARNPVITMSISIDALKLTGIRVVQDAAQFLKELSNTRKYLRNKPRSTK